MKRICIMIAMSYALPTDEIQAAYEKVNSIDVLIQAVRNSLLNHTTLQAEIAGRKKLQRIKMKELIAKLMVLYLEQREKMSEEERKLFLTRSK